MVSNEENPGLFRVFCRGLYYLPFGIGWRKYHSKYRNPYKTASIMGSNKVFFFRLFHADFTDSCWKVWCFLTSNLKKVWETSQRSTSPKNEERNFAKTWTLGLFVAWKVVWERKEVILDVKQYVKQKTLDFKKRLYSKWLRFCPHSFWISWCFVAWGFPSYPSEN